MTSDRRYDDEEVSEIFRVASEAAERNPKMVSSPGGLSLTQLKEIGREVGLAPERIAEAALAFERRGSPAPRRWYLGVPISVGRTVELSRAPTDHEWEMLVAELRQTFSAHGRVESRGPVRAWANGNLRAYVEPTENGHRLRLGTLKGDAIAVTTLGVVSTVTAVTLLFSSGASPTLVATMGLMGLSAPALTFLGLPRWARRRDEQMAHIAARAQTLIGAEPRRDA